MSFVPKNFYLLFLVLFFIAGSILSVNVGISHDEWHEEQNWKYNSEVISEAKNKFFLNKEIKTEIFSNKDKYYGVGFQYISQPVQFFLKKIIIKYQDIDNFGSKLVSKHFVVFLFFFFSGILFFKLIKKLIKQNEVCYIASSIYFLYPYLFGHSLFNPKDIPFMCIWLLCTYLSLNIFEKILKDKKLTIVKITILALSTSFLLSIRVTGILIFIQYLISLIIFFHISKLNFIEFIKKFYLEVIIFSFFFILFLIIFNPLYWLNPLSFFEAIKWMSHYYHDVCTKTLGSCMKAKNLPSSYILIWLSVKLPLIVLAGLFLIPFTEKKIFKNNLNILIFGSILSTSLIIPILLILFNVNLYDEIRHILFLVPLYLFLGLISLYFYSKKIFYALGVLSITLFVIENIKTNPYQYIWFNLPSRMIDLTEKFELDYMGISGKEISKEINKLDEKEMCILVSPSYSVKPFLVNSKYDCFDKWQLVDTNYPRPFLAIQHVRNIKKGTPYNCKTIINTGYKLLFHDKKFITGKLLKCN